jgi:hypothetical protein
LSYEIDDSTAVSTLQLWIQRDTGLATEQQELLLPSGQPFDMTKEACQCWISQAINNQVSVSYYSTESTIITQIGDENYFSNSLSKKFMVGGGGSPYNHA